MKVTLYLNSVCAGFPSPASDYLEGEIDLNRYLISGLHAKKDLTTTLSASLLLTKVSLL